MEFLDFYGETLTVPEGESMFWRPSIYGLLQNAEGEFLAVRTRGKTRMEFPGGGMKPSETFQNALKREFIEEAGVTISTVAEVKFLGDAFGYHDGDKQYEHRLFYYAVVQPDTNMNLETVVEDYGYDEEIEEVTWIHPNDFRNYEWQPPQELMIQQHFKL